MYCWTHTPLSMFGDVYHPCMYVHVCVLVFVCVCAHMCVHESCSSHCDVDGCRVYYLEINDPYRTWQESVKVDELENS